MNTEVGEGRKEQRMNYRNYVVGQKDILLGI